MGAKGSPGHEFCAVLTSSSQRERPLVVDRCRLLGNVGMFSRGANPNLNQRSNTLLWESHAPLVCCYFAALVPHLRDRDARMPKQHRKVGDCPLQEGVGGRLEGDAGQFLRDALWTCSSGKQLFKSSKSVFSSSPYFFTSIRESEINAICSIMSIAWETLVLLISSVRGD